MRVEAPAAVIDAILTRHDLSRSEIVRAAQGWSATYFCGDVVLKMIPVKWREQWERERIVLPRISGKLGVSTPALLFSGEIDDWTYLVLERLEGKSLCDVWPEVDHAGRVEIVRTIGEVMARMHACADDGCASIAIDWPAFVGLQIAGCAARQRAHGMPETLLAQLPRYLDARADRLARLPANALISGDVHHDHVLLTKDEDGHYRVTGLFDFGDAVVAAPHYDLVSPCAFIVRGDPDLARALVLGMGLAIDDELPHTLFALELLHRFSSFTRDCEMVGAPTDARTLEAMAAHFWPLGGPNR